MLKNGDEITSKGDGSMQSLVVSSETKHQLALTFRRSAMASRDPYEVLPYI